MSKKQEKEVDNLWAVPKVWEGQTAYIIGGGPSVNDLNLSLIHDKNVVGINNAYQMGHWIDYLYFMDMPWWNLHKDKPEFIQFPNPKITTLKRLRDKKHPNLKLLNGAYDAVNTPNPSKLPVRAHSGYAAINLAQKLGAKTIVLLGYDMKTREGHHNWHEDHQRQIQEKTYQKRFIPALESLVDPMKEAGIEVFNASPDSALTCWPKVDFEEFVRG